MSNKERNVLTGARIKVFGVGGAGNNAVNRMANEGLEGVDFYIANTDAQILEMSKIEHKIQLGSDGLGAGGDPENGRKAAEESREKIIEAMKGADMIFITAGLGGGTGTGASPLFAKIAQETGALTVGIVSKPFSFEGRKRRDQAEAGFKELQKHTDSLIVVANDKLLEVIGDIPLREAFREADHILHQGIRLITDLISNTSLINLDFADVRSVMADQGTALIGVGMAKGENKAVMAAREALKSPLLESQIVGATKAIINVSGGMEVTANEARLASDVIREAVGGEIDIIFGASINEQLEDNIVVSVIATGFKSFDDEEELDISFTPQSKVESQPEIKERQEVHTRDSVPDFFRSRK